MRRLSGPGLPALMSLVKERSIEVLRTEAFAYIPYTEMRPSRSTKIFGYRRAPPSLLELKGCGARRVTSKRLWQSSKLVGLRCLAYLGHALGLIIGWLTREAATMAELVLSIDQGTSGTTV